VFYFSLLSSFSFTFFFGGKSSILAAFAYLRHIVASSENNQMCECVSMNGVLRIGKRNGC
jgi:hypothetical protein